MKRIVCLLGMLCVISLLRAQVIFEEDFDDCEVDAISGIGQLPTGWIAYEDNLNTAMDYAAFGDSWSVYNAANVGKVAVSVSWTMQGNMDASIRCSRWLISPKIMIESADMDLTFMLGGNNSQFPETVKVMISTTTSDTVEFVEVERFNNVADFEECRVNLAAYAGEEVYVAFVNCGNGYFVMLDDVRVAVSEELMMHLVEAHVPYYTLRNSDTKIGGRMINKGLENISEFDAYYMVEGEKSEVTHFSGLNIPYGEVYDFVIADGLHCVEIGAKELEIWITNVNGDASVDLYDNHMRTSTVVYDASHTGNRTTLMEHFTTGDCPNCPAINRRIEEAIAGREDVIHLIHHAGYYEDEMTVDENVEMLTFYNRDGKTFAPAIMFDRSRLDYSEPGPVVEVGLVDEISTRLDEAIAQPSLATIELNGVNYDEITRRLEIGVRGDVAKELAGRELRLSVYLVEDSVWGPQMGAGDMYHMHVMRDAISNVWGDELNERNFSRVYEYDVPLEYDISHCRAVAFVSEYAEDVNHRNVVNACQSEYYLDVPQVGIENIGEAVALKIYPNPVVNDVVVVAREELKEVEVVNILGQRMISISNIGAQCVKLNSEGWDEGLYLVKVKTCKGVALRRMVVVR